MKFYKYHGTGNDFILVDNREEKINPNSRQINYLCNRHFGIGADGLILLEHSDNNDFRMKYYNADGFEGSMCGNGGRCIVAFAKFLGLIECTALFDAVDGIHKATINNEGEISLKMQDVTSYEKDGGNYILNTGSPHYVSIHNNIDNIDVVESGRAIRYNTRFNNEGINVNFISCEKNKLKINTYERGVEDETLSCGTGSVAAAVVLSIEGLAQPGQPIQVTTKGGNLKVSFITDGSTFKNVLLIGPAIQVYEGQIELSNI